MALADLRGKDHQIDLLKTENAKLAQACADNAVLSKRLEEGEASRLSEGCRYMTCPRACLPGLVLSFGGMPKVKALMSVVQEGVACSPVVLS